MADLLRSAALPYYMQVRTLFASKFCLDAPIALLANFSKKVFIIFASYLENLREGQL